MIEPYPDSIFIGDFYDPSTIVQVDENGNQIWGTQLDSNYTPANVAIADSKTYIGADGGDGVNSGRVYALSRTDGETAWTQNTKSDGMHHDIKFLITDSDDIIIGSQDSGDGEDQSPIIRKLDGETGEEVWRNTDISGTFISGAVDYQGHLYVTTVSSHLFLIHRESGETVKKTYLSSGFSKPDLSEGTIFTGSDAVTAFDVNQEEKLWERELVSKAKTPVLVFGERVFVGTEAGYVIALDKRTGDVLWEKRVRSKVRIPLVPWKGHIWVLDDAGKVYALDPESGTKLFEMEANDERRHIAATDEVLMVERQAFKASK